MSLLALVGTRMVGNRKRFGYTAFFFAATISMVSCGSGPLVASAPTPPAQPPTIVTEPANQSVPMGLTGTFSIAVTGSGTLSYQWNEDGAPIAGATSANYTTPVTTFSDSGKTFTATITNSVGSVTSSPATLAVTARAPQAGDLRFQQVDAASTVNGYTGDEFSNLLPKNGLTFGGAIGAPLSLGGTCSGGGNDPTIYDCGGWEVAAYRLPTGVIGLLAGFQSDYLEDFQADLQGTLGSATYFTGALDSPTTVITAIDMEPTYDGFATSWVTTSLSGGFDLKQHTIASSDLQQAATQEGAEGRVITAVSYDAGQVFYLSYGWQSDPSTVYEMQVENATFDTVAQVATSLAQAGYIITAAGGDYTDGILLIGTRVKGDSMPRPIMVIPAGQSPLALNQGGYAIVALINPPAGLPMWIGER
jgi:hypothetical protein